MNRIALIAVVAVSLAPIALGEEPLEKRARSANSLRVELGGGADSVVLTNSNGSFTAQIESQRGIGSCKLVLEKGRWPRSIEISLAVKDLEGFHANNGRLRLHCALHIPQPEVFELDRDGKWQEAKSRMQHRVNMKRTGDRIIVQLPAVLFTADDSIVEVHWVDYYRETHLASV